MKPYLFTYNQLCPAWYAQSILNETNAVTNWVQPFPGAAIVISNLDSRDLSAVLHERLGVVWFLITPLNSETVNGFLPANFWEFIKRDPSNSLPVFPPPPTS